jgi:succinylglutamate desuccinylase
MVQLSFFESYVDDFKNQSSRRLSLPDGIKQISDGILEYGGGDYEVGAQRILVSGGIHGNEVAGVEIINEIVEQIINQRLQIRGRVLFVLGNGKALAMNKRETEPKANMNRMFGRILQFFIDRGLTTSYEFGRVKQIEDAVRRFEPTWHFDIHQTIEPSDPFAITQLRNTKGIATYDYNVEAFLAEAKINKVVYRPTNTISSGVFSEFTGVNFGTKAMTLEIGQIGKTSPIVYQAVRDAILRVLIDGAEVFEDVEDNNSIEAYKIVDEVIKRNSSFRFYRDGLKNFDSFKAGQAICFDGQRDVVLKEPVGLLFPNDKVHPGERAGVLVKKLVPAEIIQFPVR